MPDKDPGFFNDYINIRLKLYKRGVDIENDHQKIAYVYGYPRDDVDAIFDRLDHELQTSVDQINGKYKNEMDKKLIGLKANFAFIGCSFVSDYQSFFNVLRIAFEPYPGIKMIDAAVTAETSTQSVMHIYDRVIRHKPDFTSVLIGINDMRQNNDIYASPFNSPEQYRQNLDYIAKILTHKGSKVIFNTLSSFDNHIMERSTIKNWTYDIRVSKIYNNIIREVAEENDCVLNDMSEKFKEFKGPMNIPNNGLHLTYQAQCFFADKFLETFLGML